MRNRSGKKKWMLIAFSLVGVVLLFVVASEEIGDLAGLRGSMLNDSASSKSAVSLENLDANWTNGGSLGEGRGNLEDVFGMTFNARNETNDALQEHVALYFSRDQEFNDADCLVDQRDLVIEASSSKSVEFHPRARLVDCLDAGPWYVGVHSTNGGWSALEQIYFIESGDAELAIASLDSDVAPRGMLEMQVLMHREATSTGYDGLYDFPVDVWLQQNNTLCVIEAAAVAVPRDPAAGWNQSWKATPVGLTVDLKQAKQVDASSLTMNPFLLTDELESGRRCVNCAPRKETGACKLSEGPIQVTAGPTATGFQVVKEVYHHASPVVVQTGKLQVSLKAGEVLHVSRTAYNPSIKEVRWTTSSINREKWFLGMANQTLPSRKPSEVGFTISAVGLEPGVYETTVLVSATDFYKTETRLDVEVTVMPSRSVVTDDKSISELPAGFSLGNYPNPFNPTTTIRFELMDRSQVSLAVYDVSGRQVRVLHDGELGSGVHEIGFDAGDLPSGTYLYRLTTPTASKTEKMILLK